MTVRYDGGDSSATSRWTDLSKAAWRDHVALAVQTFGLRTLDLRTRHRRDAIADHTALTRCPLRPSRER